MKTITQPEASKKVATLPHLKTVSGGQLNEMDMLALTSIARFNNVLLNFNDRADIEGEPFRVEELESPGGLKFRAITIAKDMSQEEYTQLTQAIIPITKTGR